MTTISKELSILLIGWFLGLVSSTIVPFIQNYIRNWQAKRNLKKILKVDIEMKKKHLKNIDERIKYFSASESLDDVINKFNKFLFKSEYAFPNLRPPVIYDKISIDIYKKNHSKIIDCFSNEIQLLNFCEKISILNSVVDTMENNKPIPEYETFINYCMHLKNAINEGNNISF